MPRGSSTDHSQMYHDIDGMVARYISDPARLAGFLRKTVKTIRKADLIAARNEELEQKAKVSIELIDAASDVVKVYEYVHADHDAECSCGLCRLKRVIK